MRPRNRLDFRTAQRRHIVKGGGNWRPRPKLLKADALGWLTFCAGTAFGVVVSLFLGAGGC